MKISAGTTEEQKRLYQLMNGKERRIASERMQSFLKMKMIVNVDGSDKVQILQQMAHETLFDGWLRADPNRRGLRC